MKTLELNVSERVFAFSILNSFKGDVETLGAILEDIKKVQITDEDWKTANRVFVTRSGVEVKGDFADPVDPADPVTSWKWDDVAGGLKSIELEKATCKYLLETIDERDAKKEFTLQDKAVLSLRNKLVTK